MVRDRVRGEYPTGSGHPQFWNVLRKRCFSSTCCIHSHVLHSFGKKKRYYKMSGGKVTRKHTSDLFLRNNSLCDSYNKFSKELLTQVQQRKNKNECISSALKYFEELCDLFKEMGTFFHDVATAHVIVFFTVLCRGFQAGPLHGRQLRVVW